MTMNEKKVIDKTDKTNDLIIIDPKNFGEKIKKNFNIIQSNISEKPVNETAKPSISHMKRNISIIFILVFLFIPTMKSVDTILFLMILSFSKS